MKTGTLKTLGAAALGVAFAAAAAGTATAAPMVPASPASALDSVTGQVPLGQATNLVPGAAEATGAVKSAVGDAPKTLADGGGLVGGLPIGKLGGTLPGGLPGGLPLGV